MMITTEFDGAIPVSTETINLKHPRTLEIQGRRTMRSHMFLRYSDDAASIRLQLTPDEAREIAAKLNAIADFCDAEG